MHQGHNFYHRLEYCVIHDWKELHADPECCRPRMDSRMRAEGVVRLFYWYFDLDLVTVSRLNYPVRILMTL